MWRDLRGERIDDVPREDDVLLHLVEFLRLDRRQRVLLRVDGAVLQREVDLRERDRRRIGATGLRQREIRGNVGHAHLEALHPGAVVEVLVRRRLPDAVVGHRSELDARLFPVEVGQFLECRALGPRDQMIAVPERVRVVADADPRRRARGERQSGDDHVDGAEREPLVDVRLLAEAGGREDVDVVAASGALLDLAGGPHRPLVERLAGFVDVRPLEFGLRSGGGDGERRRDGDRADRHDELGDEMHELLL